MGDGQDQRASPQAKRARISPTPVAELQGCLPGATVDGLPLVNPAQQQLPSTAAAHPAKGVSAAGAPVPSSDKPTPAPVPATAEVTKPAKVATATNGPAPKPAAPNTAANFIADAHEAVRFRAVAAPTADALNAEIASGGANVSVDFLHQHFGDSEQIRGYKDLVITIWFHVRTYHAWIDVRYALRRPGADKLSAIFEGAFPEGYCRSQEEFVSAVTATLATLPDLMTLGECIGTVPVPPTAYGLRTAAPQSPAPAGAAAAAAAPAAGGAAPMAVDGAAGTGAAAAGGPGVEAQPQRPTGAAAAAAAAGSGATQASVSVRRFQLSSAPAEVKALHARLEPLLLFTIDGANFIDGDDPQWELLLPVLRAEDGGCLVLGLTTLFNFWAYPASCRMRVSQVLVLSPWQGVGLGKALLKLSYDLAKARGCNDLTVEDPTPNLQRVREKLEVELMRTLPWVAAQADKCLEAAARGQTSWPEWDPAVAATPPPSTPPPQSEASAEAAGKEDDTPHQAQPQPHGFFSVLGVVPPEKMAVPQDVLATATAAAETRWRRRLEDAEAAATAAAEGEAKAEDGAGAAAASAQEAGAAAGSAASASAAAGAGPGGAGSACGALVPSATFVSAITKELKMHGGQVRVVWEALLWCSPRALQQPRVRAALEELVRRRLEAQHFSSVGRSAAAKRLVDIPKRPAAGADDAGKAPADQDAPKEEAELDFFMYRPLPGSAGAGGGGGAAGPGTAAASAASADAGAVATGRLNLTTVTAETKASRMDELMQERLQQLDSLAAVLNRQQRQQQTRGQQTQPARQPLLPQPLPQQQGLGGGGGAVVPPSAAGSKRKATDVAAMMKALEGRL